MEIRQNPTDSRKIALTSRQTLAHLSTSPVARFPAVRVR